MRLQPVLAVLLLSACTTPAVNAPSLAHRPAEDIDPRLPVPEPVLSTIPNPALARQLEELVAQAEQGDTAFEAALPAARQAASAAGVEQSESWIAAQQALSALIGLREPVTRAAADVDALGSDRVTKLGGLAAADLKAIDEAASTIGKIDDREAGEIKQIQSAIAP